MGLFATLNPEQLGRVQRARAAQGPFDIGPCFDAAFAALKRDFWSIVLVHLVWALLSCFIVTSPPLLVGISRFNAKVLQGSPAGFNDLFSGFDDFGPAFLMALVMLLLLSIGFFLCFAPGYYLAIAWSMSWGLLADRRGTFWECLEMSRQAVTAHWGWAFLLLLVANLVSGLGAIACGVGILATLPLHSLMVEAAYQRLFPEPPAA
jgi:uncharacterized membrane protein